MCNNYIGHTFIAALFRTKCILYITMIFLVAQKLWKMTTIASKNAIFHNLSFFELLLLHYSWFNLNYSSGIILAHKTGITHF